MEQTQIKKDPRHFAAVERFEDILRDGIVETASPVWQVEANMFTLYGYLVRGEVVINQVMHNGTASYAYTAIIGKRWSDTETFLKERFPEQK